MEVLLQKMNQFEYHKNGGGCSDPNITNL